MSTTQSETSTRRGSPSSVAIINQSLSRPRFLNKKTRCWACCRGHHGTAVYGGVGSRTMRGALPLLAEGGGEGEGGGVVSYELLC